MGTIPFLCRLASTKAEIGIGVDIPGLKVNSQLLFEPHFGRVEHKTSQKVTLLVRMKSLFDAKGMNNFHKAQAPPQMEYASLTWMARANCHLILLDEVQRRGERSINGTQHH